MTDARYARQLSVPGVGARGQSLLSAADVIVDGDGLAAEVCALYLAGAGIGTLTVAQRLFDACRSIASGVRVIGARDFIDAGKEHVEVAVAEDSGGARARFSPDNTGDALRDGSIAARWVLARVLSKRSGEAS